MEPIGVSRPEEADCCRLIAAWAFRATVSASVSDALAKLLSASDSQAVLGTCFEVRVIDAAHQVIIAVRDSHDPSLDPDALVETMLFGGWAAVPEALERLHTLTPLAQLTDLQALVRSIPRGDRDAVKVAAAIHSVAQSVIKSTLHQTDHLRRRPVGELAITLQSTFPFSPF